MVSRKSLKYRGVIADIVDEGKTVVVYDFDGINDFEDKLPKINHNSSILFQMRDECIKKSK
jgi:ribosomal protein L14E/L6E/L27E